MKNTTSSGVVKITRAMAVMPGRKRVKPALRPEQMRKKRTDAAKKAVERRKPTLAAKKRDA